jgi:Ca2+-binding EF-hand superfamily protein
MKKIVVCMAIFLIFGSTNFAQDGPPRGEGRGRGFGGQMPSFADLDKNNDKKIGRDEFQGPPQFFDRVDENRDNFIDEAEWGRIRERMGGGGGPRLAEQLSKFMDANHDTKISREEFARITQVFDTLDKDRDGLLSQEELGRFFQAMNEVQSKSTGGVEVANLFEKFDKNKDGKILAEEMNNEKTFKALDLDKDGSVTREEADQAIKQLAERSKQQKQTQTSP